MEVQQKGGSVFLSNAAMGFDQKASEIKAKFEELKTLIEVNE